MIQIIDSMFSDHNKVKLEINKKKRYLENLQIFRKQQHTSKFQMGKYASREILKQFNENENTIYQNL